MAGAKKRKTVVDTWKTKQWYDVIAPEVFEGKEIGQVAASDPSSLMNRIIEIPMSEISGNRGQIFTKLKLRITQVDGKTAKTKLIGHELSRDYIRTLVRRRKSFVDLVENYVTKDGQEIVIKIRVFVGTRIGEDKKTEIRRSVLNECAKKLPEMNYGAMENEIIAGNFSRELFNALKTIVPISKVEVRRVDLVENFKEM